MRHPTFCCPSNACVTTVVQLFLHFSSKITKLTYKHCRCFHGNQLFKCHGTSKQRFSYFYKTCSLTAVMLLELWGEIWQIQISLENVDTNIVPILEYTNFNWNTICITYLSQRIVSVVSSKRSKYVFCSRKQSQKRCALFYLTSVLIITWPYSSCWS